MSKWQKTDYKLKTNHSWRCAPGHRLCVMERGDLQFEFPHDWHVTPEEGALKVTDKVPPADDCVLRVSVLRFPAGKVGAPSLVMLLQNAFLNTERLLDSDDVQHVPREDIEIVWGEYREIDKKENREAVWRIAMSHSASSTRHLFGFLTFGFWPEHADRANKFWNHLLATLIMDRPVDDPTRGPVFH